MAPATDDVGIDEALDARGIDLPAAERAELREGQALLRRLIDRVVRHLGKREPT